jgi:branched-chain amino acid transport system ATP-binding protein
MAYTHIAEKVQSSLPWPLLGISALSKSFGRVGAISNLTFTIGQGEIVGLIGSARSGKSTVVDLVAGTIKPTFGTITIAGEDVTHFGTVSRGRRGVVCGLPPADLFRDLTALESVALGGVTSQSPFFSRRGGKTYRDEAMSTLEFAGLADVSDVRADALSTRQLRLLTIAIALAAKPALLLLDDPAAGMTKVERSALALLIAGIRENGTSVLIAERDMWPLTEVCDRILVLSSGRIIADDVPSRIAGDPAVINAYLQPHPIDTPTLEPIAI